MVRVRGGAQAQRVAHVGRPGAAHPPKAVGGGEAGGVRAVLGAEPPLVGLLLLPQRQVLRDLHVRRGEGGFALNTFMLFPYKVLKLS